MLDKYFKSIVEQDTAAVVVCDNDCKIVYMNPAAVKRYHRDLTGQSLRDCHNAASNVMIDRVLEVLKEKAPSGVRFTCNLYANPGKEPFYERCGFERLPTEEFGTGMIIKLS